MSDFRAVSPVAVGGVVHHDQLQRHNSVNSSSAQASTSSVSRIGAEVKGTPRHSSPIAPVHAMVRIEDGTNHIDTKVLAGPTPAFQVSQLEMAQDLKNLIANVEAHRSISQDREAILPQVPVLKSESGQPTADLNPYEANLAVVWSPPEAQSSVKTDS